MVTRNQSGFLFLLYDSYIKFAKFSTLLPVVCLLLISVYRDPLCARTFSNAEINAAFVFGEQIKK